MSEYIYIEHASLNKTLLAWLFSTAFLVLGANEEEPEFLKWYLSVTYVTTQRENEVYLFPLWCRKVFSLKSDRSRMQGGGRCY